MEVIKEKTEFGTNVILDDEDKYLIISYAGNLDLYWSIHYKESNINNKTTKKFIITKENYGIYQLFEKLYQDIENINFYEEEEFIPLYIENEEEKEAYLLEYRKQKEEDKKRYRQLNWSNYNELFNKETKTITWYSDETAYKVANILRIKQAKDIFLLEFIIQPYINGYDKDFHTNYYIPIRFRNSGSRYNPFNALFMRMYNNMLNIDDTRDIGHQIHIEEYLYKKKLIKKI